MLAKSSFADFQWNTNCQQAYALIIQLKFDNAQSLLEKEKKVNPENTLVFFIENYADYLKIQIGEEKSDFEKLKKNKDIRLNIIEDAESDSPWYLYSRAEINLQWAANRLKFGEYLTAALEINKAYRLIKENAERYPNFIPNKKSLGLLYTLIGSVPEQYSWVLSVIGMEGSIKTGLEMMNKAIIEMKTNRDYNIMLEESYFLYAFLKINLDNDKQDLVNLLSELKSKDHLLMNFASSRIASKLGQNDLAIKILENRKIDHDHYPFYYLEYLLAVAKQNKLDDDCIVHYNNYLKKFNGENYKKSALMRISWQYLIKGDLDNYGVFKDKIKRLGATQIDADKEAKSYSENKERPQANLLKARLLFDGGYYKDAIMELQNIDDPNFFSNSKNTLEYFYRIARCQENTENYDEAIVNYNKTIKMGSKKHYFYAAKSALQLGMYYEKIGEVKEAKKYLNTCVEMEDHQYEQGIEQKAKAGLNRLN